MRRIILRIRIGTENNGVSFKLTFEIQWKQNEKYPKLFYKCFDLNWKGSSEMIVIKTWIWEWDNEWKGVIKMRCYNFYTLITFRWFMILRMNDYSQLNQKISFLVLLLVIHVVISNMCLCKYKEAHKNWLCRKFKG